MKFDIKRALVLSLLLREAFSFWTGHPYDFELFVRIGEHIAKGNWPYEFINAYPDVSFWHEGVVGIAYPPLYAYFSALAYSLYKLLGIDLPFLYYFMLKQPMIIGDVANGYLIYKIGSKYFKNEDVKPALLWLFNPIPIIFSSIWGIPHNLAITFILLALLEFESKMSFVYITLAFLIIGLPFIYIPIYFALFLKNRKSLLKFASVFFFLGVILPLLSLTMLNLNEQYTKLLLAVEDVFAKKIFGQFNIFMILNYLLYLNSSLFSSLYYVFTLFIPYIWIPVTLATPFIYFRHKNNAKEFKEILGSFFITTIIFLIFRQTINEQYILYFLFLSIIYFANIYQDNKLKNIFIAIIINTFIFIAINNPFFIRFLAPIDASFYAKDIELTTNEPFRFIRYTLMTISGSLNTILMIYFFREIKTKI